MFSPVFLSGMAMADRAMADRPIRQAVKIFFIRQYNFVNKITFVVSSLMMVIRRFFRDFY